MGIKNNDYCSSCPQKDGCKQAYERLGKSDAPPVTGKVFWAFLAPIGFFVGLLAALTHWLPAFWTDQMRTLVIFLASAALTVTTVWIVRVAWTRVSTPAKRPRRAEQ